MHIPLESQFLFLLRKYSLCHVKFHLIHEHYRLSLEDHYKDRQSFILFAGGKVQRNDTMKADNPLMFTL